MTSLDDFLNSPSMSNSFFYWICLQVIYCTLSAGESVSKIRGKVRLEIKCEETKMRISARREFFISGCLQLGMNATQKSCRPAAEQSVSASEVVIYAGLQDCGTESRVHGDWLIYYNQLVLCPVVLSPTSDSQIAKRLSTVILVECHYKRKLRVSGQPLTPTWLPMTSTISALGLLHFSLRTVTDDLAFLRTSSTYQQGESVFLEASVEASFHAPLRVYVDHCVASSSPTLLALPNYKFITNHGCLVDSLVPNSSSKFLPRKQDNRLYFNIQAFRFNQDSGLQVFISCHLKATLSERSPDSVHKACFFHGPSFSWRDADGSSALCKCCNSDDCTGKTHSPKSHNSPPDAGKEHQAVETVGPLQTLTPPPWKGHISVIH